MFRKAIIFGAGSKTRLCIDEIMKKYEVIAIVDNDKSIWGNNLNGIRIEGPSVLNDREYDIILFSNMVATTTQAWLKQLNDMGIQKDISYEYCVFNMDARVSFLYDYAEMVYERNMKGMIAECGVFKGEFAKHMNKAFCDRKLYLFDTFEGFDSRDKERPSDEKVGRYSDTSVEYVLSKMEHSKNCIIKKGYFPDSIGDGVDDYFCFVNLDMDLPEPTKSGLEYFSKKLVDGGVILVHDYYNEHYPLIKKVVDEWLSQNREYIGIPIGDHMSILIINKCQ